MDDRTTMQCWQDLANAVVLQALEDYSAACGAIRQRGKRRAIHEARMREIEEFVSSRWYHLLSDTDGEEVLATIRKENGDDL